MAERRYSIHRLNAKGNLWVPVQAGHTWTRDEAMRFITKVQLMHQEHGVFGVRYRIRRHA